jgi:hypothetical protein
MIMPGRICVAGIAIKEKLLHLLGGMGVNPDSCFATLDAAACTALIKKSRMELASATNTNRESGDRLKVDCSSCLGGTPSLPPLPLFAEDFGKEMADAMKETALVGGRNRWCGGDLRLRRRRAGG